MAVPRCNKFTSENLVQKTVYSNNIYHGILFMSQNILFMDLRRGTQQIVFKKLRRGLRSNYDSVRERISPRSPGKTLPFQPALGTCTLEAFIRINF